MVCGLQSQPLPESFQSADLGCRFQTCQPHNRQFLEIDHFICMYNLLAMFFWRALIQGRRYLLVRTSHLKLNYWKHQIWERRKKAWQPRRRSEGTVVETFLSQKKQYPIPRGEGLQMLPGKCSIWIMERFLSTCCSLVQ